MADIKRPSFEFIFKGLGVSAFLRGQKGYLGLIVQETGLTAPNYAVYTSVADLTSTESAKWSSENLEFIKDALEGTPKKLYVFKAQVLPADTFNIIKGVVPRNCWLAFAKCSTSDTDALVSWVKSQNLNENKRYKAFTFKPTSSDDAAIVKFTNANVVFADSRGKKTGDVAVSYLAGYLAGLSLDMSAIAKPLTKFVSVEEPNDIDAAITGGEFVLINDEEQVRVARGVNSLVTTGQDVTDDFKYILVKEVMDLIFTDIYDTWNKYYKGKYKNSADNQALLFGAMGAYFDGLEIDNILDPNFDNKIEVDIEQQRLANIPKYGKDEVDSWSDDKAKEMTVATYVFGTGNLKILNTMEDIKIKVFI